MWPHRRRPRNKSSHHIIRQFTAVICHLTLVLQVLPFLSWAFSLPLLQFAGVADTNMVYRHKNNHRRSKCQRRWWQLLSNLSCCKMKQLVTVCYRDVRCVSPPDYTVSNSKSHTAALSAASYSDWFSAVSETQGKTQLQSAIWKISLSLQWVQMHWWLLFLLQQHVKSK